MKHLTLSKRQGKTNFNKLIVFTFFILCLQEIKSQKLGEFLNKEECSLHYGLGLSIQILSHAQNLYNCNFVFENINDYENKLNQLTERQKSIYEIYKDFESTSKQLKLLFGQSSLAEYFLYKEFTLKDSTCGDPEIVQKLGNSFNNCDYCLGFTMCTKKIQKERQSKISLDDSLNNSQSIQKTLVETFQLLWNCNNPNDQVEVTGLYNDVTEKQLLEADANGFKQVCELCLLQNCGVCTNNYSTCLECKDGYYMKQGVCTPCPLDNCAKCTQINAESITCNLCKPGYYLLEGKCVNECPSDYKTTQIQCLKCQPGTYVQGEICAECSKFCQQCTGHDPSQCQLCFEGFEKDLVKGCILSDFDLNPSFKPKKFVDPRTNSEKECNFSCDECIDSSDLCNKCNPELNYFIKEGDRFRCYNRCPLYFEPNLSNQDSQSKYIECIKSKSYTSDLEAADQIRNEAKSRCPKDIQTKQCQKCSNNCISCSNDSSCVECEPDYYWNINRKTCSPCHPSCKKCTGPLSKDCLSCTNTDKLFPNANGICEEAVSDPLSFQKILSQNEIYGNLQMCKPFLPQNQQQSYSVQFSQKYSTTDSQWEDIKMISKNSCIISEFQSRYKYFQNNKLDCEDQEIYSSTIGKNGDIVVIYSILLSQSRAQISAKEVNPQTLVEYAISKNFFSTNYIFNPTPTFSCSNLQCISQLDSLLFGFVSSDNKKEITIKAVKEIILTSSKQTPLNCFQDGQQVNQNSVEEIEQIINSSQYTLNTPQKQYFILYLCGKSQTANFVQKPMLVQKSLGNGFFEVLNVSNQLSSQVEVISLYGASTEQNAYLKNSDSKLSNSLNSYQALKVRIVQVIEQDPNTDKSESMFQQYNEKVNNSNTNPSKCSCVETKDYIFANENQGNQFITVITPQNKLLTQSVDVSSVSHILKKHNIDAEVMKANSLSITKIEADLLFQEYIQETVERTKQCYGISNSTPLCIINVLSDLLFSNKLECSISQEITSLVKKNDFDKLKDVIKQQNWCDLNQERCLKAQQTIKSCI